MRNRTKMVAALMLLTLPMAPAVIIQHADATPGPVCHSSQKKIDKVRKWEYNTPFFKDPDQGRIYHDDATHMIRFKLIADMRYTLCPRGALVDLIKPRSINYCYGVVYDDHDEMYDQNTFVLFDGWTMNAEAEDNFRSVNPPPKKIPEEGKSNCVRQYISTDEQKWLRRDQEPGYEVKATLNINLKSDKSWMMKSKRADGKWIAYRFFKPASDCWPRRRLVPLTCCCRSGALFVGAACRNRTDDLFITSESLPCEMIGSPVCFRRSGGCALGLDGSGDY